MSDDYKKPDGWAMPDDLAKRVSETLNNKPISPEDELSDALEDMARDIALIEPDPQDLGGCVIFLLEQKEATAMRRGKRADFDDVLDFYGVSTE